MIGLSLRPPPPLYQLWANQNIFYGCIIHLTYVRKKVSQIPLPIRIDEYSGGGGAGVIVPERVLPEMLTEVKTSVL